MVRWPPEVEHLSSGGLNRVKWRTRQCQVEDLTVSSGGLGKLPFWNRLFPPQRG